MWVCVCSVWCVCSICEGVVCCDVWSVVYESVCVTYGVCVVYVREWCGVMCGV